ncbi:uncharacterized protein LOC126898517 [Daktulosphaira vitifoliae]|uniref:uncharacterized protein LOC126898517 n=1 Tax=Daktulosphaira vitifoliae TaxID=58002 RepID=UPI0021A9DE11|nr:uncharacterized protein LOC126898517 [Daktulosphaira vitifoliae]
MIFNDTKAFVKNLIPHIIYFVICWQMTIALQKLITSHRTLIDIIMTNYFTSKVIFTIIIVITKHYLYRAQSHYIKIPLFIGVILTSAISESMCQDKYEAEAINTTLLLIFWLTALVLTAPENTYQSLMLSEQITWKRWSIIYGLTTSICYTWLKSCYQDIIYTVLKVLVVHIQLVFLCVTYFSDGQQLLKNISGRGSYNAMADSVDLYFTLDSILSRINVYNMLKL